LIAEEAFEMKLPKFLFAGESAMDGGNFVWKRLTDEEVGELRF
jgi:hypothetical protein